MMKWQWVGIWLLSASVAFAQLGNPKDAKQPVEITADAFEVRQQENVAVFTGHVIAKQGTMTLKADKMTAHYKKSGDGKNSGAGASGISRIDVDGNVLLVTPEESGSSAHGVYMVDQKLITMKENVVLTRGKNVLKGAALEYNLVTGRSNLAGGITASEGGGKSSGRVKAVFVPGESN